MGVMFISDHAKHAWSRGGNRCGRVNPSPEIYDLGDCGVGGVCFGGDGGVVKAHGGFGNGDGGGGFGPSRAKRG